ncbi:MAG: hypothetical protein ACRDH2_04310, partial [Anaerolineales bacterium]
LLALAALALLGQFLVYGHYAISLFRFPFDYDQGEGFELYDTVLHARGEWPYRDSQDFPFYTSIYPPVFHLMTVPLVWAFGPQLWTGRAVGFVASLIAASAIGWGVWRASGNKIVATFSGLAFLASNYTFHIGPLFRQHMAMVMFETLTIVALAQMDFGLPDREDPEKDRKIFAPARPLQELAPLRFNRAGWLGLIFMLAAGYTKQLALATVLAGLAFLFLRGPRRALLAGLGLAGVAGGLFLWINHATNGWWHVSIIRANINTFDLAQALSFYRQWIQLHLIIVTVAFSRLVYEIYFTRLSAYAVWLAFALANGALSGKFGAGESYFVTATAAACALSGIALASVWACSKEWPKRWAIPLALAIPVLYLTQARLTLHTYTEGPIYGPIARALGVSSAAGYYDSQGYTQLGPRPKDVDVEAGYAIAELARRAPGPVFSEEAGFMFVAGKPVVTNPFPQLVMYQAGLFDPTNEIRMINARAFGLVILRAQFYPPPVLQALGANYQPKAEIRMNGFLYRILEPRP